MSKKQKSSDSCNPNSVDAFILELLRSIKGKEVVIFCGAGISRHSALPIVKDLVPYILKKLDVGQEEAEIILNSNLPFEAFIETLRRSSHSNRILDIFDLGKPNTNHLLLAKLAKLGYVTTICTTNFDRLIERAFDSEGLVRGDDYRVYYKEGDLARIGWNDSTINLIKIHGSVEDKDNMAITLGQVASQVLSSQRKGVIDHVFCEGAHKHVLILGYRCCDVFDISPQIEAITENHKKVFLVDHEKRHELAVRDLADKEMRNPFQRFRESKWILFDTDTLMKAVWEFCLPEEEYIFSKGAMDKTAWQKCVNEWFLETEAKYTEGNKYNITGLIFDKISESQSALRYYGRALRIFRELGHKQGEGHSLGNVGGVHHNLGDYRRAIQYHLQALSINREIGNRQLEGSCLGNLGGDYGSLGENQKAINYYEQALNIAREIGDKNGEGRHLGNLGSAYHDLGENQKAIDFYEQALNIAREIGDKNGEGRHLGHLGIVYRDLGDNQKTIDFYEQALNIARETGDRRGEGRHLGNLGNAYHGLGNYQEAKQYHQQALGIAKEIGDKNGEGRHLDHLGIAHYSLGNAQKAINCYQQALSIARELGDRRGEERRLDHMGVAYSNLENCQKAIENHEQALSIAREIGDRQGEGRSLGNIGGAYLNLGDHKKAIDYYKQSLVISREINDKWGEGNCLSNLAVCYGNSGNCQKAIMYCEQALHEFRPMLGDSHPYVKRIEEYLSEAKSQLKQ